ncbi:MAG: Ig-like domain-containing protein, partial [Gemmatimonas sp.]
TGRTITWSSSNTSVATVNSTGTTTGGAAGVATITATSEGKNGTATLHVNPAPVTSVVVSPATASINKGQMVQLSATALDASNHALSGRTFTWSSGNTNIATVNSSGVVTGVNNGSVTITATETISGKQGTSAITVK